MNQGGIGDDNIPQPTKDVDGITRPNPQTNNYRHPVHGFSIFLPEQMEVEENGDNSILIMNNNSEAIPRPVNFVYVSIVTPENKDKEGVVYNYNPADYKKLLTLSVGESKTLLESEQSELSQYFVYSRVSDKDIGGKTARSFVNEKPWEMPAGTTETRYIYESNNNNIYILGHYLGGNGDGVSEIDESTADLIIQSFRES